MSDISCETVVVGGGVVGLAIARALALAGREVLIVECGDRLGDETSSRSNQVIHAGFLYPPGSLKSALCKPGRDALFAYCEAQGVAHRPSPKLMPALSESDLGQLAGLIAQGRAAGVHDLELLTAEELQRLEPQIRAAGALLSPSTGIVDAPGLVAALERDATAAGAMIALRTRVLASSCDGAELSLNVRDAEGANLTIAAGWMVNAAGCGARDLALATRGFPVEHIPDIHYSKGQFLSYSGQTGFRHLIVPFGPALAAGGSLTFDMAGQPRFGPDQSFVTACDYSLTQGAPPHAIDAIRSWWPGLNADRLAPEFSGIRPRLTGPGAPPGDWRIDGPAQHGVPNLLHLFGIDTPGLTACLAIADHVCALMDREH